MTACSVMSKASSTLASAIFAPPAPENVASGNWLRIAETSSAASKSPLASPAMSMNVFGFTVLFQRKDAKLQSRKESHFHLGISAPLRLRSEEPRVGKGLR